MVAMSRRHNGGLTLHLALAVCLALILFSADVLALWPHPKSITTGTTKREVDLSNLSLSWNASGSLPADVTAAFDRMKSSLAKSPLIDFNAPKSTKQAVSAVTSVQVQWTGAAASPKNVHLSELKAGQFALHERSPTIDSRSGQAPTPGIAAEAISRLDHLEEGYQLSLPVSGPVTIKASSYLGIFRALTTFEQLVFSSTGSDHFVLDAPITIEDEPAYPYRGLLIDTSRNFYSIASLKHQMDAMAFVKLNQFHWHIVDSQAFPLELPGELAVLSEKGAYSSSERYSASDVAELVQYAAARGINVNVEIDMPGHTYQGVVQYDKSLVTCADLSPWTTYSNEPPSGQLDLSNSKVKTYISKLLTATAKLFPSPYFSHGNDEVNLACYNATKNSDIDASLLKPFVEHVQSTLADAGKTAMVWEEAAIDFPETGAALRKDTLVQAWTTPDNVAKILSSNPGVELIQSPSPYFYLDCGRGQWLTGLTGQSWCDYVPWSLTYTFDPLNGTTPDNARRVKGGEACLWSEQSDGTSLGDGYIVDTLLWPRAGSAAEVFWTGKEKSVNGQTSKLDVSEAVGRLNELRERYVARGVAAQVVQPKWCIKDPQRCSLA